MQISSSRPEWRETATAPHQPAAQVPASNAPAQGAAVALRESGVLQGALAGLQAAPEVDLARVADIRAALSRGEIQFDAARVAALIERFHGGRG